MTAVGSEKKTIKAVTSADFLPAAGSPALECIFDMQSKFY
jgi:hypothetical protein